MTVPMCWMGLASGQGAVVWGRVGLEGGGGDWGGQGWLQARAGGGGREAMVSHGGLKHHGGVGADGWP